jgi:hypothetical protein
MNSTADIWNVLENFSMEILNKLNLAKNVLKVSVRISYS